MDIDEDKYRQLCEMLRGFRINLFQRGFAHEWSAAISAELVTLLCMQEEEQVPVIMAQLRETVELGRKEMADEISKVRH